MAQLTTPIETERLTLRRLTPDDLDGFAAIYQDPAVIRYLYWELRTRDEIRESLERRISRPVEISDTEENMLHAAVDERASGRLVGEFMLRWVPNAHRKGEVGGALHPSVHGRGYAGEVYRALLEFGFGTATLHRIEAKLDARNAASRRSLEKVGFHLEAHLRQNEWVKGEWTDELVFGMLASEWPGARAR